VHDFAAPALLAGRVKRLEATFGIAPALCIVGPGVHHRYVGTRFRGGSEAGMAHDATCDVDVTYLSEAASAEAFDRMAQREMGISGEEFLRRWDAGEWADMDPDEVPGLVDVSMALPLVR